LASTGPKGCSPRVSPEALGLIKTLPLTSVRGFFHHQVETLRNTPFVLQ